MATKAELMELEDAFHEKFGKYPFITFENVKSYGENFLMWKTELMGQNLYPYYKLGGTKTWVLWFIEGWKKIPQSSMVFDARKDLEHYKLIFELEVAHGQNLYDGNKK